MNPFNYNTYATITDLNDKTLNEIQSHQIISQDKFLKEKKHFRSSKYKWPDDAIRNWSRIWEYPYVEYNIKKQFELKNRKLKIIDFGCGVTFFPMNLAQFSEKVFCLDNNPICIDDLTQAKNHFKDLAIEPIKIDSFKLPFESKSIDIIYSVSVLEHIPNRHELIEEFSRVLKDDGHLILTYDISFKKGYDIEPHDFELLQSELNKLFKPLHPERIIHTGDLLLSDRGPYPSVKHTLSYKIPQFIKQSIIKPLIGRKTYYFPILAARGETYSKK